MNKINTQDLLVLVIRDQRIYFGNAEDGVFKPTRLCGLKSVKLTAENSTGEERARADYGIYTLEEIASSGGDHLRSELRTQEQNLLKAIFKKGEIDRNELINAEYLITESIETWAKVKRVAKLMRDTSEQISPRTSEETDYFE